MVQELEQIAMRAGWDFPFPACVPLVLLLEEEPDKLLFWRAWRWFINHGVSFVEVSPTTFRLSYAQWVRYSGPADLKWK